MRKVLKKVFRITLYVLGSILVLLLGTVVWLNTNSGKNFVRGKAEAYLRKKLGTEVYIGGLGYGLPKYVELDNVLVKDQKRDTLLSVGKLRVNINMLQLLHKKVEVKQLTLQSLHSHVYRNAPDTNFNFTYIITAFAGKPDTTTKPKDTSSSSMSISVDDVQFDDIHVHFDDHTGGTVLAVDLQHLGLQMKKLDLDAMLFHVKNLEVAGLQTSFTQDTSYLPVHPKDTGKAAFQLIADNIKLQKIDFNYDDNLNKLLFKLNLGSLATELKKFDLAKNLVDINKFELGNTTMLLTMGKSTTAPAPIDTIIKKDTTEGWHVNAGDIKLAGVNFKMDNDNQPKQPTGMDYAHLDVQHLNFYANNLLYTSDTISGNITHVTVFEQSGLDVRELKTKFNYNNGGAVLRDLYLKTPNTLLQDYAEVRYPSLEALKTRMQSMQLKVNLVKSVVGLKDVLIFAPQLAQQDLFKKFKNGQLAVEATLAGFLDKLNIGNFHLTGLDNTEVLLKGQLNGLPDANKIAYNLDIAKLASSRSDISALVPPKALESVRVPDKFNVVGKVAGTVKDYTTDLTLTSTDGGAYVKGIIAMSPGKNKERYDLVLKTDKLNLGHILKKDTLIGTVTGVINAKGTSFDPNTMNSKLTAAIQSATFKGYAYHDIKMDGTMAAKIGDIKLSSADTNLQMHMIAHADLNGKYAAVKTDIFMDSVDVRALKFYSSELRMRGDIHADFPVLDPNYPKGVFTWNKPVIVADGKRYLPDSIYISSQPNDDTGQYIVADLSVLQATIQGKTPLMSIGAIIQDHINRHYEFPLRDSLKIAKREARKEAYDTTKLRPPEDYFLIADAHIVDCPLLHGLVPGLSITDSIHIDGSLSPRDITLDVNIPGVVYDSSTLDNGNISLNGTDSAFTYLVTVDKISKGPLKLWYANIAGDLDQGKITANISLSDSVKKERFALVANMQKVGDTQVIKLQPGLKLNYDKWDVAEANKIALTPQGYYVSDFNISHSGQSININNEQPVANTPMKIDITNFRLENITNMLSGDTSLAAGAVNGNITLEKMTPSPQVTGSLKIQSLAVLGDTLGNLDVQLSNPKEKALTTTTTLKGNGNDLTLTGTYNFDADNDNDLDFDLDLNALSLHSVEHLAMGQIRRSSGSVKGKLHIQGATQSPQITGDLQTDNLTTNVCMLNATFKMPAEKISFTNEGINFQNFTIQDSAGNKATLNGQVLTADLSDIQLDMKVKANDWHALHSTIVDNKSFYGDFVFTTNLDVQGHMMAPNVDGSISILKGTNFTFVTPEKDPELESRKGIVSFVNRRDSARTKLLIPRRAVTTAKKKVMAGNEINVNISVAKEAEFSVIIDQATGDFLSVRGEASLNANVTPAGTFGLTGNYELHEGAYQLNYNFIKRKFKIQDGSTILFAGDPTKADLDVTAVYTANVAPYDLVQKQVSDPDQLNYYKQYLPFDVQLHLKGQMLLPDIKFDIVLPDNKANRMSSDAIELVQSKLTQIRTDTSELNKQVFAVLILNRFVADDPFASQGGGVSSVAIQSVSRFIGEQLNQFANHLIKGVDLSVDLATTDDYTTGDLRQRTDLNLAASKRLLNDRLKLTVGNDFELEGPQSNNNDNSFIPSNLSADYQLSADGRYTVQAYRRNYDEGVLQGFVTETGVNFIVSLDFNKFKSVFKKKKHNNQGMTKGAVTK